MTIKPKKNRSFANSMSNILSKAEFDFIMEIKISGIDSAKEIYKPTYYRTLKRRITLKSLAAEQLVYFMDKHEL